ncbi:Ubiquitin-like superfamily protein [Euphorbia peplus]|nr:Ubiquitin-like superfamily protein [Euphorbia peplus]
MEVNPNPFQIFVKLLNGKTANLIFKTPFADTQSIKHRIFTLTNIPIQSQRLISSGTQLHDDSIISTSESTLHLLLSLRGGKGGFGSLLRGAATKAGQKKTNNFDACRDMSGRRLRHVNAEKRLEEWKEGEEERRLEKIAEDFLKKNAKKGKKGRGDGETEKYVEKYRVDSAKCAAQVEEAVREACGGNGKRKGKGVKEGLDAKRLKIWMGKRHVGESDSEDSSDDEENEKSIVLNNVNQPELNKEADGSSDSVTGGKRDEGSPGGALCESGSEEDKDAVVDQNLESSPHMEIGPIKEDVIVEVEQEIHEEAITQTVVVTCSGGAEISGIDAVVAEKRENVRPDSGTPQVSSLSDELIGSKPEGEAVVTNVKDSDSEKPLNFDEFNSAAAMEVLGMERLKNELQARGLKCGGTLQERAARLFLLKSTPLDKLPKKLLAKK